MNNQLIIRPTIEEKGLADRRKIRHSFLKIIKSWKEVPLYSKNKKPVMICDMLNWLFSLANGSVTFTSEDLDEIVYFVRLAEIDKERTIHESYK